MIETVRLMREWWRQWALPECPYCGNTDIHPSTRHDPWWWVLSRLSIRPYRCGGCRRRFYLRRRGVRT